MKPRIFTVRALAFGASACCAPRLSAAFRQEAATAGKADGRPARHGPAHYLALRLARHQLAESRQGADRPRDGGGRKERPLAARLRQHRCRRKQAENDPDTPMVGSDETPPPISGWMQAKGVVEETTPNGDQIIMGAAANQEALASDPRGPANAAQSARLLYRRVVEMFPNSPLAPEAAWRAADIQWQMEKADAATLPSSHEKGSYMREQMDEDALRKVDQVLSAHALGGAGGLRSDRQQALRRLAGLGAVPGEGSRYLLKVRRRVSRRPAHRAGALRGRLPPGCAHRHVCRRRQRPTRAQTPTTSAACAWPRS